MLFRSDVMDPAPLPDDLSELERDLAGRPRQEPSAQVRLRLLAAVERELSEPQASVASLSWLRRAGWRLAFVSAAAAAVIVALLIVWSQRVHVPPPGRGVIDPPSAKVPTEPADAPLTWGAARALGDSPEALEAVMEKRLVHDRAPSTPQRAFTRIEMELFNLKGDM
jgi:uncharacterized membrane protein